MSQVLNFISTAMIAYFGDPGGLQEVKPKQPTCYSSGDSDDTSTPRTCKRQEKKTPHKRKVSKTPQKVYDVLDDSEVSDSEDDNNKKHATTLQFGQSLHSLFSD
jgi:hypothetical protein